MYISGWILGLARKIGSTENAGPDNEWPKMKDRPTRLKNNNSDVAEMAAQFVAVVVRNNGVALGLCTL